MITNTFKNITKEVEKFFLDRFNLDIHTKDNVLEDFDVEISCGIHNDGYFRFYHAYRRELFTCTIEEVQEKLKELFEEVDVYTLDFEEEKMQAVVIGFAYSLAQRRINKINNVFINEM